MSKLRDMVGGDAIVDVPTKPSVLRPYVLSHGTLESTDMRASRRFYEEFLGLEVVQHGPRSMALRCGMKFHVICVLVDEVKPRSYLTHWGMDFATREDVDQAYKLAQENKEKYAIRKITEPVEQHGVYSFYIEDLDYNWWEVQYYEGYQHSDIYEFGDVFTSSLPQ